MEYWRLKSKKDDEEPIYENNISVTDEFDIEIDERGTYRIKVSGKIPKEV